MAEKLTIAIVEDRWMLADAFRLILEDEDDLIVLPEASDLDDALRHDPDVVLLDVDNPEIDGPQVAKEIAARRPRTTVVLMSSLPDDDLIGLGSADGIGEVVSLREAADDLPAVVRRAAAHTRPPSDRRSRGEGGTDPG